MKRLLGILLALWCGIGISQAQTVDLRPWGSGVTVTATQSGTWTFQLKDGSGNAITSSTRGAEQPLSVQIVDASGNQITSFGGSGGTYETDDGAFTAGTSLGTPIMAFATSDAVDAGDVGVLAMDVNRNLKVVEASAADIKTAVELIDNAVDGNYLDANLNLAGTDVTGGAGAVAAGTPRVTLASDDPAVVDLAAIEALAITIDSDTNNIKTAVEIIDNPVSGNEMLIAGGATQTNDVKVTLDSEIVTVTPSSGATPYAFVSTASANLTNVKASAGILYSIYALNPTATVQYLRLYNKASAPDPSACSANSDCPVLYFEIPTTGDTNGAGFVLNFGTLGVEFATGIGYSISGAACTVVSTCTDETVATAGVVLNLIYE